MQVNFVVKVINGCKFSFVEEKDIPGNVNISGFPTFHKAGSDGNANEVQPPSRTNEGIKSLANEGFTVGGAGTNAKLNALDDEEAELLRKLANGGLSPEEAAAVRRRLAEIAANQGRHERFGDLKEGCPIVNFDGCSEYGKDEPLDNCTGTGIPVNLGNAGKFCCPSPNINFDVLR